MPTRRRFGGIGWSRWHRAQAPEWRSTTGTVLSATVQVGGAGGTRTEHPLVFYAYQVDGELFQGRRIQCAADASTVMDRCRAGSPVRVFYDPADPGNSTLRL